MLNGKIILPVAVITTLVVLTLIIGVRHQEDDLTDSPTTQEARVEVNTTVKSEVTEAIGTDERNSVEIDDASAGVQSNIPVAPRPSAKREKLSTEGGVAMVEKPNTATADYSAECSGKDALWICVSNASSFGGPAIVNGEPWTSWRSEAVAFDGLPKADDKIEWHGVSPVVYSDPTCREGMRRLRTGGVFKVLQRGGASLGNETAGKTRTSLCLAPQH